MKRAATVMKAFMVTIACIFVPVTTFAHDRGDLYFSIDGGAGIGFVDYAGVSGEDLGLILFGDSTLFKDSSPQSGYIISLGIGLQYYLNPVFALTGGVSYTYQTFTVRYPANTASEDFNYKVGFGFINVLIGPRFMIDPLYVGGGLFFGSETNYDAEVFAGKTSYSTIDLETTGSNFGLFLDLGLDIALDDRNGLLIFARYKKGMSYVYDQDDAVTDIKLSDISLNVGYAIKI